MIEALTDVLLAISNALLVPDILAILALCGLMLYHAGGVAAEVLLRARTRRGSPQGEPRHRGLAAMLDTALASIAAGEDRGKVLDDLELRVERELSYLQLGIRLGPVFGLAGTLIPLGPALGALASGDIETLSSQLVVAFTTTVVGLTVGAGCFILHTIRRSWYRQDLLDLEHAVGQG